MKRLTEKRNGKNVIPLRNAICGLDLPYWCLDRHNEHESFISGEAADKLSAYEDAEQEDRLVILPCKVGDVLWRVESVCYEDKCLPYTDCENCIQKGEKVIAPIKMLSKSNIFEWSKNIGIDLFLSRAEAEKAIGGILQYANDD